MTATVNTSLNMHILYTDLTMLNTLIDEGEEFPERPGCMKTA